MIKKVVCPKLVYQCKKQSLLTLLDLFFFSHKKNVFYDKIYFLKSKYNNQENMNSLGKFCMYFFDLVLLQTYLQALLIY